MTNGVMLYARLSPRHSLLFYYDLKIRIPNYDPTRLSAHLSSLAITLLTYLAILTLYYLGLWEWLEVDTYIVLTYENASTGLVRAWFLGFWAKNGSFGLIYLEIGLN